MMFSEKVKSFFPHQAMRRGQDQFISDMFKAFAEKKILLAHAPTGLGKTASALSAAILEALEKKKKVFFLTNRHTQHQMATDTLKAIREKSGVDFSCVDLIGKRWMCSQEIAGLFNSDFMEFCKMSVEKGECEFYTKVKTGKRDLQTEAKIFIKELQKKGILHNSELIALSRERRMCSYEISSALAQEATAVIADYNYLFNDFIRSSFLSKLNVRLEDIIVIVDEAHNLTGRIMDMESCFLTTQMIKNALVEARKFNYQGLLHWLQEIMQILFEMASFSEEEEENERKMKEKEVKGKEVKEKLVIPQQLIEKISAIVDYEQCIAELELAAEEVRKKQQKSLLSGVALFLKAWKNNEKGFFHYILEKQGFQGKVIELHLACLNPAIVARKIFQQVHAGILMSGTLKPLTMYKDLLGIELSMEQEYASPFPLENKLTLVVPETTTKFSERSEAMYQKIAQKCREISSLIPGNVAFFFPSYDFRDRVGSYFLSGIFSEKKLFWEKSEASKEEKELLLAKFKAGKAKGGILLGVTGANFAEGVDLPGDMLNGVVVVGLPLAKPDLKTKEIIRYYEQEFNRGWEYGYIYPAMSKCFQSAGRCIRSETDKGAVIFLDERFVRPDYFSCFPREGTMVNKNYASILRNFFG